MSQSSTIKTVVRRIVAIELVEGVSNNEMHKFVWVYITERQTGSGNRMGNAKLRILESKKFIKILV